VAKFLELYPNQGVDNRPTGQDWMMVPAGKDNYVRLVDGAGFSVRDADPKARITVSELKSGDRVILLKGDASTFSNDRLFRVHGSSSSAGPAQIIAKKGSDEVKIEVSVKKSKSFTVAYFFVQDAGAKSTRSTYTAADTDTWIKGLNDVFGPQANLWFSKIKEKDGVFVLPVPQMPEIIGPEAAKTLNAEATKLSKSGDIRIFLAGAKITSQDSAHASHVNGFYHVEQKIILMKDRAPDKKNPNPMLQTMAHEIGHFLNFNYGPGEGHDFYRRVGYPSDILNSMDGSDIKIPKQRVLNWNGS
jgi:hypothetical protein